MLNAHTLVYIWDRARRLQANGMLDTFSLSFSALRAVSYLPCHFSCTSAPTATTPTLNDGTKAYVLIYVVTFT